MTSRPVSEPSLRKTMRVLAASQLLLIVLAAGALVFLGRQIAPLLSQREQLQTEIRAQDDRRKQLQTEITQLEADKAKLEAEKAQLEADRTVLGASLRTLTAGGRQQQAMQAVETAVGLTPDAGKISPRLYIQVSTDSSAAIATELTRLLEKNGFIVPGVERVPAAPRPPELRYFHPEDEQEARRAADVVRARIPQIETRLVRGVHRAIRVRSRHLELWF